MKRQMARRTGLKESLVDATKEVRDLEIKKMEKEIRKLEWEKIEKEVKTLGEIMQRDLLEQRM